MITKFIPVLALLALSLIIGMSMVSPPNSDKPILPEEVFDYMPEKMPWYVFHNADLHKIDNDKATLGRVLFYEKRLSRLRDVSCGTCHKQEFSFADNADLSPGTGNAPVKRNTPNLNDLGWRTEHDHLFWDYRETNLKRLVVQPIENANELGLDREEAVDRLKDAKFYESLFEKAFGNMQITMDKASEALEHFMLAMTTFNSKYDSVKTHT